MKDNTIFTIKELYDWACENGIEDFTVFAHDEGGCTKNLSKSDIEIQKDEETVYL